MIPILEGRDAPGMTGDEHEDPDALDLSDEQVAVLRALVTNGDHYTTTPPSQDELRMSLVDYGHGHGGNLVTCKRMWSGSWPWRWSITEAGRWALAATDGGAS